MNINYKKLRLRIACLASLPIMMIGSRVSAQTPPASPPAGGTFEQRLAQRKAERKITLDDKTQKRITLVCTKAQGVVRQVQQDTRPITNRTSAYQRVDAKLWVVIGKLKLAGKDTFKLEEHRTALAEKTAAFQDTSANYKQALDDTVVINCQTDIVGFKALVDTTRIYQSQLLAQAQDIRGYVLNQVKPALAEHVADLQPKSNTGGQ